LMAPAATVTAKISKNCSGGIMDFPLSY